MNSFRLKTEIQVNRERTTKKEYKQRERPMYGKKYKNIYLYICFSLFFLGFHSLNSFPKWLERIVKEFVAGVSSVRKKMAWEVIKWGKKCTF